MTSLPNNQVTYRKGIVKCAADDCDRMTRSNRSRKADHPGTFVRTGRGLCPRHYVRVTAQERGERNELRYPVLPCTGCGHPTRSTVDKPDLAPGTRRRVSHGRCTECVKAGRVVVPAEKVAAAQSELDSFLAARKRRVDAAARRQGGARLRVAS